MPIGYLPQFHVSEAEEKHEENYSSLQRDIKFLEKKKLGRKVKEIWKKESRESGLEFETPCLRAW